MPNWCNNQATITFRTPQEAADFIAQCTRRPEQPVIGTLFDVIPAFEPDLFQHYHPQPEGMKDDNWMNWRYDNWGTKWSPDMDNITQTDTCTLGLSFSTAWSPPIAWLEHCGIAYGWEWEIAYIELGCDFAGEAQGNEDGITLSDQCSSADREGFQEIADMFGIDLDEAYDDGSEPVA